MLNFNKSKMARQHDLDALRAFAMLLGIVFHAAVPYARLDPVTLQLDPFELFSAFTHGFRMHVFFMLSGFFTAMLWRRRGLRRMLRQRFMRILLPLVIALPLVTLAVKAVDVYEMGGTGHDIWQGAQNDDVHTLALMVESGMDVDSPTTDGWTPLLFAAYHGSTEAAAWLIEHGAAVNPPAPRDFAGLTPLDIAVLGAQIDGRDFAAITELLQSHGSRVGPWYAAAVGDSALLADLIAPQAAAQLSRSGWTLLHIAAGYGHQTIATWLLDHGADVNAANVQGRTPLDEALLADQPDTAALLQARGGTETLSGAATATFADYTDNPLLALLLKERLLGVLWFLWYLWLLVVGFAVAAFILDRVTLPALPDRWVMSPARYLWLVPVTMIFQAQMDYPIYGPDWVPQLLVPPYMLAYYGLFFGFGALYYHYFQHPQFGPDTRRWGPMLALGSLVVFPLGYVLTYIADGWTLPAVFLQSLYPWVMSFGLIGLFRRFLNTENDAVRYVSDSSYFLYLAHLPLVNFLAVTLAPLPLPNWALWVLVSGVTIGALLVVYEYAVRYTFIGAFLNGPRQRPGRQEARSSPAASTGR